MIFDYPEPRDHRRHDPRGYKNYSAYRPWLRDEFAFRCVYCLKREQWGQVTGDFDIDHFQPQSRVPGRRLDYANLLYACHRCNSVKLDEEVADPFIGLTNRSIKTLPDGAIEGIDAAGQKLILQLDLNSPRLVKWRLLMMRIVELAAQDQDLLRQLTGFPTDLPRLQSRRPPAGNGRPEGIAESWFVRKQQSALPDSY